MCFLIGFACLQLTGCNGLAIDTIWSNAHLFIVCSALLLGCSDDKRLSDPMVAWRKRH